VSPHTGLTLISYGKSINISPLTGLCKSTEARQPLPDRSLTGSNFKRRSLNEGGRQ
jgi:hypothetical protein